MSFPIRRVLLVSASFILAVSIAPTSRAQEPGPSEVTAVVAGPSDFEAGLLAKSSHATGLAISLHSPRISRVPSSCHLSADYRTEMA
jgi:hypothetical protein